MILRVTAAVVLGCASAAVAAAQDETSKFRLTRTERMTPARWESCIKAQF